ncbi:hypothetical protein [Desulfovibrio inopinatus]|uniref:hypothetical protein n=1 Tax=Desulfovibrio inopinatus TaxID=102109 RepID=UPI000411748A|nr:hypothetical protein [Desulfovibrio inopinatus]
MRQLAGQYLDFFDFEATDSGICVILLDDAPEELAQLVETIFGGNTPDALSRAYEALTVASEADDPYSAEVDEKVCPFDMYAFMMEMLERFKENKGQ